MLKDTCIFLAGGGTGGHLFPGIALVQALNAQGAGVKPIFLCTKKAIDQTILGPTGYEFVPQPIVPPVRSIGGLVRFWRGWRETADLVTRLLDERKPACVIGLGGYGAGVAVKYAAKRKVPTVLINPDVVPGKANKYLLQFAHAVCCQFEATKHYLPASQHGKIRVTGCPIRASLLTLPSRAEAAQRFGLDPTLHTVVVTGASLGSRTVNEGALAALVDLKPQGWQVLHLAGSEHAAAVRDGYRAAALPATVVDFTSDMGHVWALADLAISRAGASSCAELTACGVPSILMPYPYHKDQHQKRNAEALVAAGAAVLCEDAKEAATNAVALKPILQSLLFDAKLRQQMSAAAKAEGKPRAAEAMAEVVAKILLNSR